MSLTHWILVSLVHLLILDGSWVTCRECNDGEYVPDPYDCNGFLQCSFGRWVQRFCPRDLHFNRVNFVCDFPWNANCVINEDTTTTTTTPDDPPTPTDPTTSTNMPGPSTTTSTTTSSPTTTATTTSPTGPPIGTTTNSPTTSTTIPTPSPTFPTPPPALECWQTDGQYVQHLPHPNCSMFYKCVHGIPHEMLCPFAQHWAISLDRCDSPSEANCRDGAAREQANAREPNYW